MECNAKVDIEDSRFFLLALPQTNGLCNTVIDVPYFYPLDKLLKKVWQNMINIDWISKNCGEKTQKILTDRD